MSFPVHLDKIKIKVTAFVAKNLSLKSTFIDSWVQQRSPDHQISRNIFIHTGITHTYIYSLFSLLIKASLCTLSVFQSLSLPDTNTHTHKHAICHTKNSAAVHSIYLLIELLRDNIIGFKMS